MEKNVSKDLVAIKDFLDRLLRDRLHRVHTSWLDWVQPKKTSNESDNTFLLWFNTPKSKIGNKTNDSAKIKVMLFFTRLDEPMEQKICNQSNMQETKHDPVALTKKLWSNQDREPKPSWSTRTRPTPSTSTEPERNDAAIASFSYEDKHKKEVFCSYYERNRYKEAKCWKKSRDAQQHEGAKSTTAGAKVSMMNGSGSGDCQAKDKNPACRQWLVVVLVGQEVQALIDTTSDLNLSWKDNVDHHGLRRLFLARAATQAGGIPLEIYLVFHERLQITD